MWKQAKPYLIVASVTLNVAFVAMWIAHAAPSHMCHERTGSRATAETIWCPLHRELKVTHQQWVEIEPRLREFQAAVAELRQQTNAIRSQVIDLIAAGEPDVETIRGKQDEILATKRRIQRLVVDHLLAEKEVLTPAQQQQLFAMLREWTGCNADPPMSGPPRGGLGRVLQNGDASQR